MYVYVITLCFVAMVTGDRHGYTDNNDEVWAYQWYVDEPFVMECNSSKLNVSVDEYIVWETPSGMILPNEIMSENYEVMNKSGVHNMNLLIKSVKPELHGVYICSVHPSQNGTARARMILGLNIHERKYRDMFDKYRDNVIVAVIATAVFVVPLGTSCFVYHFQYMTPETKARKQKRKSGWPTHEHTANDTDIPMKSTEKFGDSKTEQNGRDGYENLGFSTQL